MARSPTRPARSNGNSPAPGSARRLPSRSSPPLAGAGASAMRLILQCTLGCATPMRPEQTLPPTLSRPIGPRRAVTAVTISRMRSWTRRPAPTPRPAQLTLGDKNWSFPLYDGTIGPRGHRHQQALRRGRHLHLRSRLHLDRELRIQDHLYRRRRRHPALSRLSDRAARRARRLSRDLLPAALRRTADRRAEGRFRLPRDPSHDGARADEPVLPGFPARRPPDGGDGRLRRRALGLLSRLHRHLRSARSAWSPRSA